MNFKKWLQISEGKTAARSPLYPLGYGGIGLYPYEYWLPSTADALVYMMDDPRLCYFKNGEGPPFKITHIYGAPSWPVGKNPHCGEKAPFSIVHVPGHGSWPDNKSANNGDGEPFSIKHIK